MHELDAPIRHRRTASASGNSDLDRERGRLEASASGRNDASSHARGGRSCATQEDRPRPSWARVGRSAERRPWTGRTRAARAGRRDERSDPRLTWLLAQARRWKDANEKTLVFVAHRETLEMLRTAFSHRAQLATGAFHEELSAARRDIEVALFRNPEGPSLLVSTEAAARVATSSSAGGSCSSTCRGSRRPSSSASAASIESAVACRSRSSTSVHRTASARDVVRLLEALDVFIEPSAGLEPQLAHVERDAGGDRARPGRLID